MGRGAIVCAVAVSMVTLSLVGSPIAAQESGSDPAVFSALEGRWIGEGELMGRPAQFEMNWESQGDGLAVLDFANGYLHAVAIYRTGGGPAEATWLDSRPERITIEWEATDSVLTAHWRSPSESGRTEYEVLSPDRAVVRDYVDGPAGERLFGEARYRREAGGRSP